MIIKVCGLTLEENYHEILKIGADMVGINFYPPSSRFINGRPLPRHGNEIRVGVFVNASLAELELKASEYDLDYIQLHGDEDLEFCYRAAEILPLIKVSRINDSFDWKRVNQFGICQYHLFDTASQLYGGSGYKFDWSFLKKYEGDIPFLLAGGISPGDAAALKKIQHPQFAGVDINSKFEISPGTKDTQLVSDFIKEIKK